MESPAIIAAAAVAFVTALSVHLLKPYLSFKEKQAATELDAEKVALKTKVETIVGEVSRCQEEHSKARDSITALEKKADDAIEEGRRCREVQEQLKIDAITAKAKADMALEKSKVLESVLGILGKKVSDSISCTVKMQDQLNQISQSSQSA